ncbi:MAG TPA: hypothetical protein PK636_03365, partial [bacterium]|nr:hypothetical protein [bacterium]
DGGLRTGAQSGRVMPCSVLLEGEYGCRGVFMGVPAVLGSGGVERIVEVALSPEETAAFRASAEAVRRGIEKLEPQGDGNGT